MSTNQNTAVAPVIKKPADVRNYIQSDAVRKQIAMVLPTHLTTDVMTRVVCTAILKTPKLAECRIESLLQSIMLLSQFGMLPDGRSAHLIPYFNSKAGCFDCQAIIDWKGKVARAQQNGVDNITADVVCMNDKFTWKVGNDGLIFEHERDWRDPDRGDVFAAYVVWKSAGKFSGTIMSKLEIEAIRRRSKSPDKGPWATDWDEMAKKTVVHRASKFWPLDAAFRDAIEVQEVTSPTIDLPALPVVSDDDQIPGAEVPDKFAAPAANAPNPPPAQSAAQVPPAAETPEQTAKRVIIEAGVPFDLFQADITARNIALNADSWPDYEAVPVGVWKTLAAQTKTQANMIRKFGKND
jgi:recombination protein RecT